MASAPAAAQLELDHRAWEQCVANLHRELGRIASREDCQDAVQDALTDALRRPGLSVDNVGGWVLVIARRRLLDRHRKLHGRSRDERARRRFVHAEASDLAEERVSETELVDLLENGASEAATEAMARLNAEQQRLLTLALERMHYPDVGEILGISPKAAKERTLRAWKALRDAFIETELGAECTDCRRSLARRRTRGKAGVGERRALIAHLETCAPCRAYEKRMKGLIATSPAPTLPFWQQLLLRFEQFLAGAPGPRTVESAAATALNNGGTGTLARMVAALCAGATAVGMCAAVVVPGHRKAPPPRAAAPRPTATPALARAATTSPPAATPTVRPTRTPRPSTRKHDSNNEPTGNAAHDTRSVTQRRPASAPTGSTTTSEFIPNGGGSNASNAAAPASAAGGGEFRP